MLGMVPLSDKYTKVPFKHIQRAHLTLLWEKMIQTLILTRDAGKLSEADCIVAAFQHGWDFKMQDKKNGDNWVLGKERGKKRKQKTCKCIHYRIQSMRRRKGLYSQQHSKFTFVPEQTICFLEQRKTSGGVSVSVPSHPWPIDLISDSTWTRQTVAYRRDHRTHLSAPDPFAPSPVCPFTHSKHLYIHQLDFQYSGVNGKVAAQFHLTWELGATLGP